jgi:predicted acylesterase/phospholipase RssA
LRVLTFAFYFCEYAIYVQRHVGEGAVTQFKEVAIFNDGVNLALGGGGAKGFVHLGVVEGLAELRVPIRAIVGTSIGAIIGALFAHYSTTLFRETENPQLEAARAVTELFMHENFWREADWNFLSPLRRGLLRGGGISDWLSAKLYDQEKLRPIRFDDLKFPLTVTATDAHDGECLILNCDTEGSMFVHRAVRASMSIQWVFREITLEVEGKPRLCWDGGTTGNCRFDIANRLYPSRPTIASSLTYRGEVVTTHTGLLGATFRPIKVLSHSMSIMMRAVEQAIREAIPASEAQNTIFIEPRLEYSAGRVDTFDFGLRRQYREELVENGRHAVREKLCSKS